VDMLLQLYSPVRHSNSSQEILSVVLSVMYLCTSPLLILVQSLKLIAASRPHVSKKACTGKTNPDMPGGLC
jgi:hypothetical protein